MTDPFHTQIRAALDDPVLQTALDGNAERRQKAWTPAFASLPESRDALRRRAHAVRAETIAHLPDHLERFTQNLRRNGIIYHYAQDSSAAVDIILAILNANQGKLVAKAKSMVSEEIHLNQALGKAGIRAVETDLGEYIVQLRGEPPAHIITPAVHLTRAQVAQTFVDVLGVDYTEDIPTLTAIARRELRSVFLDADIGISGVNFGVAETGALVTVTNEGNGRMCTTIPPVHIALMGIERLVPTLDDLALMLYLLPRSATGQKLSVYTSLIHSPRRPGELDGPQERHLVLLDNGRSAMRGSPLNDALLCIRCGACLNACPVFREIGGHAYRSTNGQISPYPGPIGSVVSPGLFGYEAFGHLARASSLCGACKDACPVDIDLPKLLLRVRYAGSDLKRNAADSSSDHGTHAQAEAPEPAVRSHVPVGLRAGLRMFGWMAHSPRRFAFVQRLAGGMLRLVPGLHGWLRLPAWTGWGYRRDFPVPAAQPFRDRFASLPRAALVLGSDRLQAQLVQDAPAHQPYPPADQPVIPQVVPGDLADRFAVELEALGGLTVRCGLDGLAESIRAVLQDRRVTAIQAWNEHQLPEGLLESLAAAGIQIHQIPDPQLRLGLTGALAGIAETGTLVIAGGPECPLTASLLPEIHFAVLRRSDILATLPEALRLEEVSAAAASVLISGPSRTADIEMTLTIGVHGPRELVVYII